MSPMMCVVRRLLPAVMAVTLLASACGSSGAADDSGTGDQHGAGGHDTAQELGEDVPVPTIAIEVTEDPVEGWNLRIHTTDFEIVPENVSTAHVDGEGHMHLYIDGQKVSRVYGGWHHIAPLEPGEHEVRVELSSNNHSALAVGGEIIDAAAVIVAGETDSDAMGHGHDHGATREAIEPLPSLSIEIVDDPAGGWSLHAVPSNFRLAPENASGAHSDGEGHMHLYINGDKVARLYETWFEMPPLPSGVHEIRVDLQSNDHAPMTVNGTIVALDGDAAGFRGRGHDGPSATITAPRPRSRHRRRPCHGGRTDPLRR